jgi:acetate---CoA ligase (ADP-forming)
MNNSIKNFFYPETICIAGASSKEKSIGYELLRTIKDYGYTGKLLPVNPKGGNVLGYDCYLTIEDIKENIDMAIVVVPKQFAESSIDSLLKKNVKSIILITAGFKEIGKEGEETEKRITQKIKDAGARMVGPNCMGVINALPSTRLNATFVAERPEAGSLAFLSQSGALGAAVLNSLRDSDIKFSHFVSVGNKADINENDLQKYWQEDDNIKILTFYLESFVNGEDFIKPVMLNEITKPVIVLKAGKTSSGMKAASSHTGALSSKDKIVDALLKQFGIIRANDLNELFNSAKGFENFPTPKGNRVAVITNAGGPAILTVDSLEKENLDLAVFTEETKKKLREFVHPEGSVENPIDMLPGATAEAYKKANELAAADENVDAVISIFVEPVMVQPMPVIEGINFIETGKPILQICMPLPEFWNNYRKESKTKKPIFRNPEDPAEVISNMLFYSNAQKKLKDNFAGYHSLINNSDKVRYNFNSGFVAPAEISQICNDYKIPIIKDYLVKPEDLHYFSEIDYPLVIKGINKEIVHKTEMSAVKLNIADKDELIIAAEEIKESFAKQNYNVEEFLIQPFIKTRHELLIGGFRDPSFGPIIMFGTGGKYVEVVSDTSIKSAYLSDADIDEMIDSTTIGKILKGVRGEASSDLPELKRIIKASAKMIADNKNILEFDLNPLLVTEQNKFYAVDARIKFE